MKPTPEIMPEKLKEGKLRLDLLEPLFLEEMARVLGKALEKYTEGSWRGVDLRDTYAAAMRHLVKWRSGEKVDPETQMSHLAHCACNLMFALCNEKELENLKTNKKLGS